MVFRGNRTSLCRIHFDRLESGEDAVVPAIWFYEASAVLSRAQNRGTLANHKADEFCEGRREDTVAISLFGGAW